MFQGSMVALVSPMTQDGELDWTSLERLIEFHLESGTHALVIAGTTGEAVTLTESEFSELLRRSKAIADRHVPVIAGSGSSCTRTTVELTRIAYEAGVDACLIATPAYNKPTQAGLIAHYSKVAESVPVPIILYNVPGRTACDMLPETVVALSRISNVVGVKEATGELPRASQILSEAEPGFCLLSGDDPTALGLMMAGAQGVISVTANVAPSAMVNLCTAALAGDEILAKELDSSLQELHKVLFVESNPIPTKWALEQMGLIKGGIRLPLTELDPKYHDEVTSVLTKTGIYKK